jgi:hypothetical protein
MQKNYYQGKGTMKNKHQQNNLYGLILIGMGSILLITVGLPMIMSMLTVALGLFLINYGLLLRGGPSLFMILQRIIEEIRIRFF